MLIKGSCLCPFNELPYQQHFEKFVHKGLSLAIYLKIFVIVIPKQGFADTRPAKTLFRNQIRENN